jgi:histone H2A
VVQSDIVDVVVDAIVHPTNASFYLGGEVGSAISAKGGKETRDIVARLNTDHGNLAVGGGNFILFEINFSS